MDDPPPSSETSLAAVTAPLGFLVAALATSLDAPPWSSQGARPPPLILDSIPQPILTKSRPLFLFHSDALSLGSPSLVLFPHLR